MEFQSVTLSRDFVSKLDTASQRFRLSRRRLLELLAGERLDNALTKGEITMPSRKLTAM